MGLFPLVQYAQLLFKSNQWRPCAEWIPFIPIAKNKTKNHLAPVPGGLRWDEVGECYCGEQHEHGLELHIALQLTILQRFLTVIRRALSGGRALHVGCVSTPAAAGWRSCAAGARAGQSAASASSAPSSAKSPDKMQHSCQPSACRSCRPPAPRQTLRLDGLWYSAKPKMCAAVWSALASDERSRILDTKTETRLQEISEIKQSAWVITQVLASITEGIKMSFRLRINFKQHKGVICASTLKRNNINSEKTKFCNECSQRNSSAWRKSG